MARQRPVIHARDHGHGGADPVLIAWEDVGTGGGSLYDLILATTGLAGFWPLNESSGDIAHDVSGNGWDMTSGASWGPPTWGQPAGPPGDTSAGFGSALGETNPSFGALSGDLTLEIWAYRTTTYGGTLIGQGDPSAANTAGVSLYIENPSTGAGNRAELIIGDTTGGPHVLESSSPLATGSWYYIAATRLGGVWTLYLNGAAQTATYNDGGTNYNAAAGITLGNVAAVSVVNYFEGHLSYAAAYSRALTAAEIGDHYSATSAAAAPTLAAVLAAGNDAAGTAILNSPLARSSQTASYTLVLADAGKLVTLNNASAVTLTVPANATVAYPAGTVVTLVQLGAGQVTVAAAAGVTVSSRGAALKIAGQYGAATLIKTGTDTWVLSGDVTT